MMKPLGHKAYGSIPHLPNSRLGVGDYHCHEGHARIACEKPRDKNDRVIVTEKLDGSNVCVANVGGTIAAITRAGYLAKSSPFKMHHDFADWVMRRNWSRLPVGYRLCGEWMQVAHGTIYEGVSPLVGFDVFDGENKRIPHDAAREMMELLNVTGAHVISDGPPLSVEGAMSALGVNGFHGATEQVEGAVWRVERYGQFDFLAKFVRHDKQDGKYLSGVGRDEPLIMVQI